MQAWVDTLCLLAQPKEGQQQFKNKKQPELTENRPHWKSDNQGDKEETVIQTVGGAEKGSRGGHDRGNMARPRDMVDCGTNRAGSAAPHSHIDKPGGMAGEQNRLHNPGP